MKLVIEMTPHPEDTDGQELAGLLRKSIEDGDSFTLYYVEPPTEEEPEEDTGIETEPEDMGEGWYLELGHDEEVAVDSVDVEA
jgi:hypothetical protein